MLPVAWLVVTLQPFSRRRRRTSRFAISAVALAVVPVLAGCNTSPGAAALVGGNRISIGTLQHVVSADLADPSISTALANPQFSAQLGKNQAGFVRITLARLISEQVLGRLAAEHHVTVTPAEVASQTASFVQQAGTLQALQTQAAQQVGVNAAQLPELIHFTIVQQKLSDALVADQPVTHAQLVAEYTKDIDQFDQVDLAQIAVTKKSTAQLVLHKAKTKPASFGALAKKYSTDAQTKATGGNIGFIGRNQLASVLGSDPKTIKTGQVLMTHSSSGYVIVHVIKTKKTSLAAATAQLKSSLLANQAQTLLEQAAVAESKKLNVQVSPRYGVWNATTQTITAPKSKVSSPS
jgi:parvulin-like peptidyl-prolyl isomerase